MTRERIYQVKISIAEHIYRTACRLPIGVLALPGIDGATRWAEEVVREHRAREMERRYELVRQRLEEANG